LGCVHGMVSSIIDGFPSTPFRLVCLKIRLNGV
jgi:hypothetical protein